MKKRLFIVTLILTLAFASTVSASAYSQEAGASITRSGSRITFTGTMKTDATKPFVSFIQASQHVYDFASGKTLFDDFESAEKASSIKVTNSLGSIQKYWYCNDVHGLVQYAGDSTYYHDDAYKELNLMSGKSMSLYNTLTYDSIYEGHKLGRDAILTSFGYDPQSYDFYLNADAKKIMSDEAYVNMRQQLHLSEGDAIPGYYFDKENSKILAVNQTSDGENHLYVFEETQDGTWMIEA